MKRGRKPGCVKTGGRQKGTPNKATAAIRAALEKEIPLAISTLASILRSKKTTSLEKVAAAKELLMYAVPKPSQAITLSGDEEKPPVNVNTTISAADAELVERYERVCEDLGTISTRLTPA